MSATPYEEMESTVFNNIQTLAKLFIKLNEEHEEVAQVANVVRGKLEEFREELPMIKYITSEAI
jgi:dynein heavy chain